MNKCPVIDTINYLGGIESPAIENDTGVIFDGYVCDNVKYFHSTLEILFARAQVSNGLPAYYSTIQWMHGNSGDIASSLARKLLPVELMRQLSSYYRSYVAAAIMKVAAGNPVTIISLVIPERRCFIENPASIISLAQDISQYSGVPMPEIDLPPLEQFELTEIAPDEQFPARVQEYHLRLRTIFEWLRKYERVYCALCNFILDAIRAVEKNN